MLHCNLLYSVTAYTIYKQYCRKQMEAGISLSKNYHVKEKILFQLQHNHTLLTQLSLFTTLHTINEQFCVNKWKPESLSNY